MKPWKKILLWSFSTLAVSVVGAAVLFRTLIAGMCGNEIFSESVSPKGNLKAVVFQRDCGATTGFSTQVSILDANQQLRNESGNIFTVDGHPNDVQVVVRWLGASKLQVETPAWKTANSAKKSWRGGEVIVSYVQSGT